MDVIEDELYMDDLFGPDNIHYNAAHPFPHIRPFGSEDLQKFLKKSSNEDSAKKISWREENPRKGPHFNKTPVSFTEVSCIWVSSVYSFYTGIDIWKYTNLSNHIAWSVKFKL